MSLFTIRRRLPWVTLSLATVATLILVACGGTSTTPAQSSPTATTPPTSTQSITPVAVANVKIIEKDGNYLFDPASLTIKVGTQVVWTNETDAPHTVTSDTNAFNTPDNLAKNQTFMFIFTKPGTYTYYCNFHPTTMKGTIIVTT